MMRTDFSATFPLFGVNIYAALLRVVRERQSRRTRGHGRDAAERRREGGGMVRKVKV